jgi:hypothetical protein
VEGVAVYNATCTPGYLNNEGGGDMKAARSASYMGSMLDYAEGLDRWREAGDFKGAVLTRSTGT